MVQALSSIQASFEVESSLLDELERFIAGFEGDSLDDAALDAFQQRVSALENQRMQLQIERQQKLQTRQPG